MTVQLLPGGILSKPRSRSAASAPLARCGRHAEGVRRAAVLAVRGALNGKSARFSDGSPSGEFLHGEVQFFFWGGGEVLGFLFGCVSVWFLPGPR